MTEKNHCCSNHFLSTECAICLDPIPNPMTLPCGHQYHHQCIEQLMISSNQQQSCPLCRAPIPLNSKQKIMKANALFDEIQYLIRNKITFWSNLTDFEQIHMNEIISLWYEAMDEGEEMIAMYNLGILYRRGWGIEQNNLMAFEMFERAASLGHADAQNNLAYLYQHGIELGTPYSLYKANFWYHKAAEQNHAQAQYNLGIISSKMMGHDNEETQEWFNKALNQGCEEATRALIKCGKIHPFQCYTLSDEEMNEDETFLESQLESAY